MSRFKPGDAFVQFTPETPRSYQQLHDEYSDYKEEYDRSLTTLEVRDLSWIIDQRPAVLRFFQWLLISQNIVVFGLVIIALVNHQLGELQLVFSVLVTATLAETAFAIRFIVKFLFQKITYQNRYNQPSK